MEVEDAEGGGRTRTGRTGKDATDPRCSPTAVDRTRSTTPAVDRTRSTAPAVDRTRSTAPAVYRTRSTAPAVDRTLSTAPAVDRTRSTAPDVDPRRSFLHRVQNNDEAGTSMSGSQERRRDEVNCKLKKLGLQPKEIQNGQKNSGFLSLATKTGIYDCPIQNDTIYEEQEEEDEEDYYHDMVGIQHEETHYNESQDGELQYESEEQTEEIRNEEQNVVQGKKKKRGERGPTKLKRFWYEYEPNTTINMAFNHLGQPCGTKRSRLSNFIGSLVKGKEISLAATNWNKVPTSEKEKLWNTVKAFFNIDESHKCWVLTSASKKWKDFKSVMKSKHFDAELSVNQNIANGCNGRIPATQWAWLVKYWKTNKAQVRSEKNKGTRTTQANAVHTSGSRGFVVVHDQLEIREGRRVSRAELYCATHTNKKGNPVNGFSADKISTIKGKLAANPSLIGEEAHEEDLYSTLFPKGKTSTRHGLGLVVGGKGYERINQVVAALRQSQEENRDLRRMVETMMETQKCLVQQNQEVQDKCNQMMVMFQASQKQNSTQHVEEVEGREAPKQQSATQKHAAATPGFEAEIGPLKSLEPEVDKPKTKRKERKLNKPETKHPEAPKLEQGKVDKLEDSNAEKLKATPNKTQQVPKIVKVKAEKAEANKAEWLKAASNRKAEVIQKGTEVSLRSPNSLVLAAMGTVQNTDQNALGLDGKPLSSYVEVLVNCVMNETTRLPRAYGRIKTLKGATAKCIPWPRININLITESDLYHREIFKSLDDHFIPEDLRSPKAVDEWRRTGKVPQMKKRKRTDNDAIVKDGGNVNSQAAQC